MCSLHLCSWLQSQTHIYHFFLLSPISHSLPSVRSSATCGSLPGVAALYLCCLVSDSLVSLYWVAGFLIKTV